MVESAIALPLFLLLLVVSFDLLRVSYSLLTVQFVSSRVMRNAVIGEMSGADIRDGIITFAGNLGVTVRPEHITLCPLGVHPCTGINPGAPHELMTLEVNVPVGGFLLGATAGALARRNFNLSAVVVSRMEPAL